MNDRKESGQSILIIAFIVVLLLGLVAVVVDVGNAYAHRRIVQNAVDAAALAGARKLAERATGATLTHIDILYQIDTYAKANGLPADEDGVVQAWFIDKNGVDLYAVRRGFDFVPSEVDGVRVEGNLTFDTYFAHMLGFAELKATTDAQAWVLKGPCDGEELFPIGISLDTFQEDPRGEPVLDKIYTMWDVEKEAPGQFGWLYWEDGDGTVRGTEPPNQNSNTTNLSANILDTTRSGRWSKGDWVKGGTGVSMQPVLAEINQRLNGTLPATVIVPIWEEVTGTGDNTLFKIYGFGAFHLTCAHNSKNHYEEENSGDCGEWVDENEKYVRGYFEGWVEATGEGGCLDTGISIPSFRAPK